MYSFSSSLFALSIFIFCVGKVSKNHICEVMSVLVNIAFGCSSTAETSCSPKIALRILASLPVGLPVLMSVDEEMMPAVALLPLAFSRFIRLMICIINRNCPSDFLGVTTLPLASLTTKKLLFALFILSTTTS